MDQDGREGFSSQPMNAGTGGNDRIVIMRLCSCTTGISYRSELVPFPASYEDAMLDAIAVFIDSLPPNTTPSEIEIKYAFKCADGNGGWAGLSRTKGSPEKWRQALKSSNSGACELGVFHVSSVQTKNACASREFPYSSQTTQNATATGAAQTRVSVKFDTEQVVFDAPSTLEACITIVNAAFYDAIYHENSRRRFITNQNSSSRPPETKLFAHSVHGRLNMELDGEEYNKMRMLNPTVIYLEAIRIF